MNMITIKNVILTLVAVFAFSACDMFKIDNYPGPNASINGGIIDELTGELVPTDLVNGSRFQFQELGYPAGLITRSIMQDGKYRDDLFFAGTYSIDFNQCNFFPHKIETITFQKGNNTQDFKVTPYIRVKTLSISKVGNLIVAKFTLQAGRDNVRLSRIDLYAGTDIYIGSGFTYFTRAGSGYSQSFSNVVINEANVYELSLDLKNVSNNDFFKYKKNYYFRVGALATVSGTNVGTIRNNYGETVVLNFKANE